MSRMKTISRKAMLANINGLSKGDKAYCGPYGTVECTKSAGETGTTRRFKVSGNENGKFANRGNWTMKSLREAAQA